ncbi:MAG: NADH-quinone oxidoreductase subunit N [Chitinophagales bacterium]
MPLHYVAPELILAGVALLLILLKVLGVALDAGTNTGLATLGLLGAGLALAPLRGESISLLGGTFVLDSLAFYFKALFLVTTLLVLWGSSSYVKRTWGGRPEFHFLLLLSTVSMMLMVSAGELISLYLALEFSVITFFALSVLSPRRVRPLEATLKYVLIAGASAAFLLYGMTFLYGLTGTTNLEEIGVRLQGAAWSPVLVISTLLILAGFGFKLAAFPFHFWAPDLYEAAPTPVVAFLAVASKAAALAVMLRVFTTALGVVAREWAWGLGLVSAASILLGNLAAIPQTDLKRLLAYSSIAQSGYLLLGLAAPDLPGLAATLFYAALYTLSNLAAFLVVIACEEVSGRTDLASFSGLARRAPFLALVMLLALLSLGGLPPLAGFIGKFVLFMAVINQGRLWLVLVAATLSVVSVYYYLNVARVMYIEAPEEPPAAPEAGPAPAPLPAGWRLAPTTFLAILLSLVGTLYLGIYPRWLLVAADWATRLFWG